MTEDEAMTKWCPQARVDSTAANRASASGFNMGAGPDPRCIGSDCMAWRWSEPKRTAAFLEAVQKHMQGQDKPNFNTATQAVFAETGGQFARVEGGCGLAGEIQ